MPSARPLEARSGPVTLAGTLWEPDGDAVATVLMHPGSGPSNRDNDVYFPQVRAVLLDAGIAAASFDKRGVGGSTGDWREAGIVEQAADAAAAARRAAGGRRAPSRSACSATARAVGSSSRRPPRGAPTAFVVTNGGPGVSPAVQDRFALANLGRRAGRSPEGVERLLARYDLMVELLRDGVSAADAASRLGPPDGHELDATARSTTRSGSCSDGWSTTTPARRCAASPSPCWPCSAPTTRSRPSPSASRPSEPRSAPTS